MVVVLKDAMPSESDIRKDAVASIGFE
jgi:hypothetical protein